MKKDVLISIQSTQQVDGDRDEMELTTFGSYYKKNGKYYIVYQESEATGFEEDTVTTVKVEGENRVTMIRNGLQRSQNADGATCAITVRNTAILSSGCWQRISSPLWMRTAAGLISTIRWISTVRLPVKIQYESMSRSVIENMNNLVSKAMDEVRETVMNALGACIADGSLEAQPLPAFLVEIPADKSHGDFATNVAMVCARVFHKAPRQIAELIKSHLDLQGTCFSSCEIAGPGFINFFLSSNWFANTVEEVLAQGEQYGRSDFGAGKRVLVEFVSANPTGPMHIGNARGGAIGDSLASVLDWAGYCVEREFYVNDAGNQINKFGLSLSLRYQQLYQQGIEMPEGTYLGQDIIDHAKNFAALHGDKYMTVSEEERRKALVDYALPLNIEGLKQDLEKEGALWFKATDFGSEDFVLVRSNGIPTYVVPDIAYHYNKLVTRGFDKAIDVLGADHHGYIPRLKASMQALGVDADKLDAVLMQMVRLVRDGQIIKASKRSGKAITLVTLLDEVPIDAARFFFNLREANSHFDFDLDLAVEQSSQNPVYYVQYAHARICSIVKNLAGEGIAPRTCTTEELSRLSQPEEIELIRHLAGLPNEIIDAAKAYDPARITRYAIELATLFHKFYNACKVKGEEEPLMQARLNLCLAVRIALKNVLTLLKIQAPETM